MPKLYFGEPDVWRITEQRYTLYLRNLIDSLAYYKRSWITCYSMCTSVSNNSKYLKNFSCHSWWRQILSFNLNLTSFNRYKYKWIIGIFFSRQFYILRNMVLRSGYTPMFGVDGGVQKFRVIFNTIQAVLLERLLKPGWGGGAAPHIKLV